MAKPITIDEYAATFPQEIRVLIQQMREVIKEAAPDAEELISYNVPAFRLNAMLVWFGAHTHHIGLYPRGSAIEKFSEELSGYKTAKGSVQFPYNKPMPFELIKEMVKFRVGENLQRVKIRKK